jgi:uncharacterized protein DUF3568
MSDNFKTYRKDPIKSVMVLIGIFSTIVLHTGCAQIIVPGTLAGAGELYRYSAGNVAEQTMVGALDQVVVAAKSALKKMEIDFVGIDPSENEVLLHARTHELEIEIELQKVTPTTTRAEVNAVKNHVVKDKATASEILNQIKVSLEAEKVTSPAFRQVFIKNKCGWPIRVAVYFLPDTEGKRTWQTSGWYLLDPEQRKHTADMKNRFVYFYAESTAGENYYWSGSNYQSFEGRRYGFFEADLGDERIDFTQTFNCSP